MSSPFILSFSFSWKMKRHFSDNHSRVGPMLWMISFGRFEPIFFKTNVLIICLYVGICIWCVPIYIHMYVGDMYLSQNCIFSPIWSQNYFPNHNIGTSIHCYIFIPPVNMPSSGHWLVVLLILVQWALALGGTENINKRNPTKMPNSKHINTLCSVHKNWKE
jgi:hypothetical protein